MAYETLTGKRYALLCRAMRELRGRISALDTLVSAAVKQLAQDVLQDIFSAITEENYGEPAIDPLAPSAFDYKKLLTTMELAIGPEPTTC